MLDCLSWAFESNSLSSLFKFSKCVSQSFFFFVVFHLFVCRFPLRCLYQPVNARMNYQESEYLMEHCSRSVEINPAYFLHGFVFPCCWLEIFAPFSQAIRKAQTSRLHVFYRTFDAGDLYSHSVVVCLL